MAAKKIEVRRELRSEIENWLRSLAAEERSELDERIVSLLAGWLKSQSGMWAMYKPAGFEPNITALEKKASHLSWCYPLVAGDHLEFYSDVKEWTQNQWGLTQPVAATAKRVLLSDISGILIPGVSFDLSGVRLGRGKGFYDRSLANWQGTKVGVAYSYQIAEELVSDSHDVRMNYLATELEWRKVK